MKRCNSCGRVDVAVEEFECTWPDGRTTHERHCSFCMRVWHPQLLSLGAKLRPLTPERQDLPDLRRSVGGA